MKIYIYILNYILFYYIHITYILFYNYILHTYYFKFNIEKIKKFKKLS